MSDQNFRMDQFDQAVVAGRATWWKMELPSGKVLFGKQKAKMLGYPASRFRHYQDFVELVHPEDQEKTMLAMRNHLDGRAKLYEAAYRIRAKNGEYLRFYDCGQIISKEGDKVDVCGFVMKVKPDGDIPKQIKRFKDMILAGHPSIAELVARMQQLKVDIKDVLL